MPDAQQIASAAGHRIKHALCNLPSAAFQSKQRLICRRFMNSGLAPARQRARRSVSTLTPAPNTISRAAPLPPDKTDEILGSVSQSFGFASHASSLWFVACRRRKTAARFCATCLCLTAQMFLPAMTTVAPRIADGVPSVVDDCSSTAQPSRSGFCSTVAGSVSFVSLPSHMPTVSTSETLCV